MPHLRRSSLIDELGRIASELRVRGGTFGHWMPHPCDVPPTERQRLRNAAERTATDRCLADLLASVGLPAVAPAHLGSGARKWPPGYTGSVSHKGATVVAAIAPTDRMTSIGIDIERLDGKDVPVISELDGPRQPSAVAGETRTILFSIQEAAYKALDPVVGHNICAKDIHVSWSRPGPVRSRAVARARGVAVEVRCSVAVASWIVSAALWPVTVAPGLRPRCDGV